MTSTTDILVTEICALTSPYLERVIELIRHFEPLLLRQKETEWTFDITDLSNSTISKIEHVIRVFRESTTASPPDTNTIPFGQPNLIQNANYLLALKEARGAGLSPISKMDASNSSSTPDFVTPVIPMKRRKRKSTSVPSSSQSSVTKRVTKRVKTQHETKTKTELVKVNDHVRKHNDEKKSYMCNYPDCGKQFATTSDLKVHQRSHGEIFNHYCQFCKRGFNHKAMWQVHTRTHTGEKPYGCKFCDMRFSDKSNMRRHVRRRHQPSNK